MTTLKVSKTLTIEDIDDLYQKLAKWEGKIDLYLPNSITSWDFGISTLLIQFVNSWIRSGKQGLLVLDALKHNLHDEDVSIDIPDHIFPSIIMCWDKGIVDSKRNDLKSVLRPYNEVIIKSMQSLDTTPIFKPKLIKQKGFKSLLTCFDHLPPDKGLLQCFYINNQFISNEETLLDTLEETFDYIISYSSKTKQAFHKVKVELAGIIYELMANTHQWGRTDPNSQFLNPNIRGILLKFVKKKRTSFVDNYVEHEGLRDYFLSFKGSGALEELHFIEISVFDSGAGFVDKYHGSENPDMPINDQVITIKDCLIEHNTSDKTINRETKGKGLNRIMRILDKKGFFLIRTSNCFVFRNMKDHPHLETDDNKDIQLFDYKTCSSDDFSFYPKCSGSNVTIVYPVIEE